MKPINPLSFATAPVATWLDYSILFGTILLIAVAAFLWLVFFPQKKHHHHKRRRTRRRHREQQRPMNPTLAETGGLPPAREKDSASN